MHVVRATELTSITTEDALALSALDLTIEKGSVFGLAGPANAGKTTLLRTILGLVAPTDGTLLVFGEPMHPRRSDLRRRLGYVATRAALPSHLTVKRFLEFSGELAGLPRRIARRRLARLVDTVGLSTGVYTRISDLDAAERTRVATAAALMNDPELLLLDAPTNDLPPTEAQAMIDLIRELAGPDRTIIFASRRLDELERVCTDIGVLSAGRMIYLGPADELRELARQTSISVEVDGHLAAFERALAGIEEPDAIRIERTGVEFAITGLGPRGPADYLRAIVEAADRTGVELVRVDVGGRDLTDAYLARLDADRRDGSLRTSAWASQARDTLEDGAENGRPSGNVDRAVEARRDLAEAGD